MANFVARTNVGDIQLANVLGVQYIGHDDNLIRDGSFRDLNKVKLTQVMMVGGGFAFLLDTQDDIRAFENVWSLYIINMQPIS